MSTSRLRSIFYRVTIETKYSGRYVAYFAIAESIREVSGTILMKSDALRRNKYLVSSWAKVSTWLAILGIQPNGESREPNF